MSTIIAEKYVIIRVGETGHMSIQREGELYEYAKLAMELIQLSRSIEATYYMMKIHKVIEVK